MRPKREFQNVQGAVQRHADLVSSREFRIALDYAILEYTSKQVVMVHENPAAVAHRIEGAHQFIETFLELGDLPQKLVRRDQDNLQSHS